MTFNIPISFWAVAQRLKNIGAQRKWCILLLVPVINFILLSGYLTRPEGYWETKKLDSTGRISAGAIVILVTVLLGIGMIGLRR